MLISFKDFIKIPNEIQQQGYEAIVEYAQKHNFIDIKKKKPSKAIEAKPKLKRNSLL